MDSWQSWLKKNLQALAFGYFEALIRTGDSLRVQSEIVRLKSMNNLLNAMGHDPEVYEDFVEDTLALLERTRVDMDMMKDNERMLLASFNDAGIAGGIITHFRVCIMTLSQCLVVLAHPLNMDIAYYGCMDEDKPRCLPAIHRRLHH